MQTDDLCTSKHPTEGVRCERAAGHQHKWHIHGIDNPGRGITVWGVDPTLRRKQ